MKGLFLVRVESFDDERGDPRKIGFDASLEFQPRWSALGNIRIFRRKWWHRSRLRTAEAAFHKNVLCDYNDLVRNTLAAPIPQYPYIRCVLPGFDNSPRRKQGAAILINSTPEIYERWLCEIVNRRRTGITGTGSPGHAEDSLVFINAWNEWGEGNHLEPCRRWGHRYLEATRRALKAL